MTVKIFLTGVTGYIAGDALYVLNKAHPDYEYAALVRSQEKADKVKAAYPNIRIVLGDLDDSSILEEEAAKADIVLHAADASDHEGAAKAIARGLSGAGHSRERPGFWLHTGGTGILIYLDWNTNKFGEWEERQFNDYTGVAELTTLPDEAFHRTVDKIVLETATRHGGSVKTAIVCPPTIYGTGRGPVSVRGRQVYELSKLVLREGYAPIPGKGRARWNNVHIHDLSDVYLRLVDGAVARNLDPEIWGEKGYFFTENGEHVWGDLSRLVAKKAAELGYIKDDFKERQIEKQEALEIPDSEAVSWGLNSRGKAERARKFLGWKPTAPSLEDEVEAILKEEKSRLSA